MEKMARPLPGLLIRQMTREDVVGAQEVGVAAWSDLASRELGRKVRYPVRPTRVIEAYLWKEPRGCLVAEHQGKIIGASYSHVWGKVGWLGPFEVLPEMQNKGVGTALLEESEKFREASGCRVQGLETMANNPKNIHFYMKGGYRVLGSSLIMEKSLRADVEDPPRIEEASLQDVMSDLSGISEMSRRGHPLLDYAKEVEMAVRYDLGATFLFRSRAKLKGMAILHLYYPPEEADHASLRLLLVDPRSKVQKRIFDTLLASCEAWAFNHGRKRVFVRFPGSNLDLYEGFLDHGYRLAAANLRMVRGDRFLESGRYHLAAWAG